MDVGTNCKGQSSSSLSLAGAVTSIIFVMTKVLLRQTCLSQQKYACHHKCFVVTKLCLSWQNIYLIQNIFVMTNICCDKHNFVMTNVLCLSQQMCLSQQNTSLVTTSMLVETKLLLRQKLSCDKQFCHDKYTFVMTRHDKHGKTCHDKSDTFGSSCGWCVTGIVLCM